MAATLAPLTAATLILVGVLRLGCPSGIESTD